MVWIIVVSVFVFITLLGLVIFSWRNAKRSIKPTVITTEREIEWNRKKGLWLDLIPMTVQIMRSKARTAISFMLCAFPLKKRAVQAGM